MPVVPGDQNTVRNGTLVLPPGVSGANQISIIGGKVTSLGQAKTLPTTTMSPASAGVIAVKHIGKIFFFVEIQICIVFFIRVCVKLNISNFTQFKICDIFGCMEILVSKLFVLDANNETLVKGTEGELLSMKVVQSDILPTGKMDHVLNCDANIQ